MAFFLLVIINLLVGVKATVCDDSEPYIVDNTGGVLEYKPWSGFVNYRDKLRLRDGLENCFKRTRTIMTCYSDENYRYRKQCPFYVDFEDHDFSFDLTADLGNNAIQYSGTEAYF